MTEQQHRKVTLSDILIGKKREIERAKRKCPLPSLVKLVENVREQDAVRPFKDAVSQGEISIIAEIKRKSPSHGELDMNLDVREVAREYDDAKDVACISIVTDREHFGCDLEDMKAIRSETRKPILRKDFILDEYQIYEARLYGADAVLLIASILEDHDIRQFAEVSRRLKMEPFVECHEIGDVGKIPDDVELVGINSRNLNAEDLRQTCNTDLSRIEEILPEISSDKVVIAESGVKSACDMLRLKRLGRISAVLTGASIVGRPDRKAAIEDLMKDIHQEAGG